MMSSLISIASIFLATVQIAPFRESTLQGCAKSYGEASVIYRLADLPHVVRNDLLSRIKTIGGDLADSHVPIFQTDAPRTNENIYAPERFEQEFLARNFLFVQIELAMIPGVSTLAYRRNYDGKFIYSPSHNLNGPACASIKAALSGVTQVDGF